MVLADVGLGDLLWTALWVFGLILLIWVFIAIVSDLFRDDELSGVAKAVWVLALIVFPLVASLVYLVVRGRGIAARVSAHQQAAKASFDSYIRTTAASTGTGPIDDLTRLDELHQRGVVTDAEFESMKSRITHGAAPA